MCGNKKKVGDGGRKSILHKFLGEEIKRGEGGRKINYRLE